MAKVIKNSANGIFSVYIPRNVARDLNIKKGDEIEFVEAEDLSRDEGKAFLLRKK